MDSDQYDEAEAAREAAIGKANDDFSDWQFDNDESAPLFGELLSIGKPPLLRWVDSDYPEVEAYLNLNTFYGATVAEGRLYVSVGPGGPISTEDADTIHRFFEQFEVV